MIFLRKWLSVPVTNELVEKEAAQLWYVRWTGRTGTYRSDVVPLMEAFPSEGDAKEFARSLTAAFKLLQISGDATQVSVGTR